MSKHTPGPWRVGHHIADDEGYREITILASVKGGTFCPATVVLQFPHVPGMQEANARLIAASPDLLDAAKDALCTLEIVGGYDYVLSRLRRAIEKATSSTSQQS